MFPTTDFSRVLGKKQYFLTDHRGNNNVTILDSRVGVESVTNPGTVAYYLPVIDRAVDFFPFGREQNGRIFNKDNSEFGYNGKQNIKEWSARLGGTQNYGFRIKSGEGFLSRDPLASNFPWYTPYQFAGNKPIVAIDLDGLEEYVVINTYDSDAPELTLVNTQIITVVNKSDVHQNLKLSDKFTNEYFGNSNVLVITTFTGPSATLFETKNDLSQREKEILKQKEIDIQSEPGVTYSLPKYNIEGEEVLRADEIWRGKQSYNTSIDLFLPDAYSTDAWDDLSSGLENSVKGSGITQGTLILESVDVSFAVQSSMDQFKSQIQSDIQSKYGASSIINFSIDPKIKDQIVSENVETTSNYKNAINVNLNVSPTEAPHD